MHYETNNDFRKLLDQKGIDAVVVSTPDHVHAVASVMAMKSGRHVYCEKPLTRTVSEARIVEQTARRYQRATQMGTQIHAGKQGCFWPITNRRYSRVQLCATTGDPLNKRDSPVPQTSGRERGPNPQARKPA